MKVLVSNDDGIHARGLENLCSALDRIGLEVLVCAPDRERSAASHALTMYTPLRCLELDKHSLEASRVWTVDGTPADCVKVALELLLKDSLPDFVVSGINRGPNLGTDIMYSGTVAAAAEGCLMGIRSMAISCTAKRSPDYLAASGFIKGHFLSIMGNGIPAGTMVNVNVPPDAQKEQGSYIFRYTKAGTMKYSEAFDVRNDPRGRQYIWMSGEPMDIDTDEDYDTVTVKRGICSVTPLRFDFTDTEYLDKLRGQGK